MMAALKPGLHFALMRRLRGVRMSRLPWIQRAANAAERAGDWPVLIALAFAVGVVFTLAVTGQL